jgi:hypothetical protein
MTGLVPFNYVFSDGSGRGATAPRYVASARCWSAPHPACFSGLIGFSPGVYARAVRGTHVRMGPGRSRSGGQMPSAPTFFQPPFPVRFR